MPERFSQRVRVRFRDLDGMGHVNHAVYLTYLEEARVAFFERLFGALPAERPFSFVVVRAEIDYKRPAMLAETLTVELSVARLGSSSFEFAYEVRDDAGKPVAGARTVQVFLDRAGRPTPVPDAVRKAFEPFLA